MKKTLLILVSFLLTSCSDMIALEQVDNTVLCNGCHCSEFIRPNTVVLPKKAEVIKWEI